MKRTTRSAAVDDTDNESRVKHATRRKNEMNMRKITNVAEVGLRAWYQESGGTSYKVESGSSHLGKSNQIEST